MSEITITYETLYELLRREKFRQELQQLTPTFYQDTVNYIKEKQIILDSQKNKDSIFATESEKTSKQLESINKILKELYERREGKLIQLAIFSSRINKQENITIMLPEEKLLYIQIKDVLNKFRKDILYNILTLQVPNIQPNPEPKPLKANEEDPTKLIKFIHHTPKFVGNDLNTYGPFEEEDIGNLPKEVANLLINKNRAEELS